MKYKTMNDLIKIGVLRIDSESPEEIYTADGNCYQRLNFCTVINGTEYDYIRNPNPGFQVTY